MWMFGIFLGKQTNSNWNWPNRNSWFTHEKWWIFPPPKKVNPRSAPQVGRFLKFRRSQLASLWYRWFCKLYILYIYIWLNESLWLYAYICMIFHIFPYVYYTYSSSTSLGVLRMPQFFSASSLGPWLDGTSWSCRNLQRCTGCGTPLDDARCINKIQQEQKNMPEYWWHEDISISDLFTDSLDEERLNQQKVRCHRILATNLDSGCRGGLKQFFATVVWQSIDI